MHACTVEVQLKSSKLNGKRWITESKGSEHSLLDTLVKSVRWTFEYLEDLGKIFLQWGILCVFDESLKAEFS